MCLFDYILYPHTMTNKILFIFLFMDNKDNKDFKHLRFKHSSLKVVFYWELKKKKKPVQYNIDTFLFYLNII